MTGIGNSVIEACTKGPSQSQTRTSICRRSSIQWTLLLCGEEMVAFTFSKETNTGDITTRLKRIDHGYPRPIRGAWNGVPDNLDAAMQWKNGKSYFFKGIRYYGLDDHTLTVPSIYPRRISTYWMSCSAKGLINSKLAPIKQGNDTSQVPTTDSSSNASPPSGTSTKSHSAASGVSFSVTLLLICFVVHRFSLYDF